ncbi:GGDEF domain-containing protein [Actinoplanes sp. L3-i22]|uniref:GGDEF domain-containing protein n=1 Tax=Actinoplanes sp. L3-i22 TaxID=2836373 RepID=UPI001C7966BB|nr:GGDEF domain-containing protein [Actinoplanes sp. L3-i22]BCY14231.1 hypothetical protein L3i22_093190 [Actinoplanes sp. L3-i22]
MQRDWLSLPTRTVDRTRLAAACIGGLAILVQLGQVGNAVRSAAYHRVAAASIVAVVVLIVVMHRRRRSSWWSVPVLPVLVTLGAAGLKDPLAGTAIALAALIVCSLYDTNRRWLARMAGSLVAMPAAVAISPDVVSQATSWHSPSVLGLLPQIFLMGVLTRAFYLGLERQERAAARDARLTQAGHELLAVTDGAEIRRIGERTSQELVRMHPGVALLIAFRDTDGLRVTFGAGTPDGLAGHRLAGDVPDEAELTTLVPGFDRWHVDPLGGEPATAPLLMLVGGRRAVPVEVLDAFRSLSYQVILADEAHQARVELEYRAHHDHLTGLPTRAKFLRAAGSAIDGGDPVALLNIDLDGFKRVNDEHGHAAGDELLVAVAERIGAATGRDGVAARFGGDEFALLLTGPAGADRARRLCAELCEPVRLTAGTVRVGASIGVAFAEPGVTVADLLRRADQAMYAAKAGGKNRVVCYGAVVKDAVAV